MRRRRDIWLATAAVLLFFFLALDSLTGDSPTMDEQNHLARGLALWKTGDPRLSLEHPPLVNLLSTLPAAALLDVRLPLDDPSWDAPFGWYEFARLMMWQMGNDVSPLLFLARLPVVLLTLGLALIGLQVGRRLWGGDAGLAAFGLFLFEPNLLAHGRYATTDLGAAAFLFLAAFLVWRLWQAERTWPHLLLAGIGLGLAFGTKLSLLGFVPIWALLALLPPGGDGWTARAAARRLVRFLLAGLISLPVLWALFAFEWRPFHFQSDLLLGLNRFSGPMPTFWAGIEQIVLLSGGGRPSFLLGQFSADGFAAYFPVAFLVKTPLPVLLALPAAAVILLVHRRTRPPALFLLLTAVLFFALSVQSGLNIGYRHLLPILPLLLLLISGLASNQLPVTSRQLRGRFTFHLLRFTPLLVIAGLLLADVTIHPHYLSYFNAAAGGPENGRNILVDSNIDWGQDLLRLRGWMTENDVSSVKLAWFGTADPDYYAIDYEPLPGLPYHFDLWWDVPFDPAAPEPGVYAISVSNLWELPLDEKVVFPAFRARPPDGRVGYSILIYDLR